MARAATSRPGEDVGGQVATGVPAQQAEPDGEARRWEVHGGQSAPLAGVRESNGGDEADGDAGGQSGQRHTPGGVIWARSTVA